MHKTIVMVHGLGGSDASTYMIRIGNKFFDEGYKVVRVNLRGCGSGNELSKLPYHGGTSSDLLSVFKHLKYQTPLSPMLS